MSFKLIFDNFHGNIELSNLESELLKSPIVNRLHQILQNSSAYLVFPCLKTARFEHSIGTMGYSSQIFVNGLRNSIYLEDYIEHKTNVLKVIIHENQAQFFDCCYNSRGGKDQERFRLMLLKHHNAENLDGLLDSPEILEEIYNLTGRVFLSRNIEMTKIDTVPQKFTLIALFQAVRLLGLFHDIGHLPFSHLFELSLESLRERLAEQNDQEQLAGISKIILEMLDTLNSEPGIDYKSDQLHELLGKRITTYIFQEALTDIYEDEMLDDLAKASKIFALSCIKSVWNETIKYEDNRLYSLYSIVSGTIDSDRLDFIQRDGASSGVNMATGNIDRIIKLFCLTKLPKENPNHLEEEPFRFLPSIQALHDVEKVLHDRFNIYKYMVNHHAVKRSDYIFQKGIENELMYEIKAGKQFSTGWSVNLLIDTINIANDLFTKKQYNQFEAFIHKYTQVSDFWLLSRFTSRYTEVYFDASQELDTYRDLLKEIFENRRRYKSLWKRIFEYRIFVEELGKEFLSSGKCIDEEKYQRLSETDLSTFKPLYESLKNEPNDYQVGTSLLEVLIARYLWQWCKKIENQCRELDDSVVYLIVPTRIKVGIKDDFMLIDNKKQDSIYLFNDVSRLKLSLEEDLKNTIKFFSYFCPKIGNSEDRYATAGKIIRKSIINLAIENLKQKGLCV